MSIPLNRRRFLQTVAAAAGALSFPTIIPDAAFGANRKKISVGCIGIGRLNGGGGGQGGRVMKNFLSRDEDCRVVAVCDPYRDRHEGAKRIVDETNGDNGCVAYGDFRELIARTDIDAVICDIDNLTNEQITSYRGTRDRIFSRSYYGLAVTVGIAGRF